MTDQPPDLSDLQQRIAAAREREEAATRPDPQKRATASGYGMAMRLAMEMVAALGVSVVLGIWLDGELGTAPLFIMMKQCVACMTQVCTSKVKVTVLV